MALIDFGLMETISPLPAIVVLIVALTTTWVLMKIFGTPSSQGRYASIDGLRGYLAFFVFLHHSCIWYFYLRTGQWEAPPSNLYNHFGQSSVVLFFMITGFLFFSKLIEVRTKPIDWGKLYISRVLRLTPLYLFVIILLFVAVAYLSKWTLKEPLQNIITEIIRWMCFTIHGDPDINGIKNTALFLARATWTLPYEWFFYITLPLLALTVKVKPPIHYIAFSILGIVGMLILWHPSTFPLLSFLGGIIAAFLVRFELFRYFALKQVSSFITLGCICIAVAIFPGAFGVGPILLLSVAFALIAGGNSIFGVLLSPVSRTLGEMTYSIYLLHGLALFSTFTFVFDVIDFKTIFPITYWLVVVGITPILIFVSFFTFRWIERPALQFANTFTAWLRKI
jgi:peptidoglycan/LPS O-acetylase OafA/YrhL